MYEVCGDKEIKDKNIKIREVVQYERNNVYQNRTSYRKEMC